MTHQSPTFLPLLSKNPPNHSGHILHGRVKSNDFLCYYLFFYILYIFHIIFLRAEKQNGVKIKIKWKLKLKEK